MSDVISPCVRNCCLDRDDICMGCFRHIDEIMQWSAANEKKKQITLKSAQQRKQIHSQKRG